MRLKFFYVCLSTIIILIKNSRHLHHHFYSHGKLVLKFDGKWLDMVLVFNIKYIFFERMSYASGADNMIIDK